MSEQPTVMVLASLERTDRLPTVIAWLRQPAAALPANAEALLAPTEAATYATLKVPKRRGDWLLGRITAKQLVAAYLGRRGSAPLADALVIAADADGAPYASLDGKRLPLSLSISHSHATAFCALAEGEGITVGADIEYIEARDSAFLRDFFTAREQAAALALPEPHTAATLLWSAKESVLKALREGLRIDTKQLEITLPAVLGNEWAALDIVLDPALAERFPGAWSGWARRDGAFVLTMALCAGGAP